MSLKMLLMFSCTFLLVQSSYSKALTSAEESGTVKDSAEESSKVTTDDTTESSETIFLFHILRQFLKLTDKTLINAKKIFQDVVVDISALENKNEEVSEKLKKYKNFVIKIDQLEAASISEGFIAKFDIMNKLSDPEENSNTASSKESTNADKLLDESLKNHGSTDLEEEFEKKFEEFNKDFIIEAAKIIDSKIVEEWPGKTNVQEWLNKFKTEHDVEKIMGLFEKFFDLLD